MESKKTLIKIVNVFFFLVWIALIGVTIWPITGLYGRTNWWTGNTTIRATEWAGWGSIIGLIGLIIHLKILVKREKINLKIAKRLVIGAGVMTIFLTGLCLPYFIIPLTTADNAEAEFAKTYGPSWKTRIQRPTNGPWLDEPVSQLQQYVHLPYDESQYNLTLDVEFLKRGNDSFKCDIYLPTTGTGPFPVMIEIHGGGWLGGDKNAFKYQLEYFASQGYAIFCVQYGAVAEKWMARQYSLQEIMDNLAAFSDWLAAQQNQYHLNLSRVFTNGYSAGGHLSALVGVARFNVSAWNPAVNVIGAIVYYGIPDFRHWAVLSPSWFNASGLYNSSILTDYSLIDKYSPMTYVEYPRYAMSSIVPLLVLHGDADSVVPVTQNQEFDMMCDARGWPCTYIEIPNGEHCFEGDSNSAMTQISLWAMERFMQLC